MGAVRGLIFVIISTGAAAATAVHAQAPAPVTEIYNCVDREGKRLYTSDKREANRPGLKCKLVSREVNVVPAQKPSPSNFPRESANERAARSAGQRDLLEKELATEQRLLDQARKDLAEQEAIRTGGEKNYARVEERLQPYKDKVDGHQKNIDNLKRELSNTR
jgi:hypothetical protein